MPSTDGTSIAPTGVSRRSLMYQLSVLRKNLRTHGIRDAADYAEVLVAQAVDGDHVVSRVNKGHDVLSSQFGRVEVRCRQLPPDGRIEERVEISATKKSGFDRIPVESGAIR